MTGTHTAKKLSCFQICEFVLTFLHWENTSQYIEYIYSSTYLLVSSRGELIRAASCNSESSRFIQVRMVVIFVSYKSRLHSIINQWLEFRIQPMKKSTKPTKPLFQRRYELNSLPVNIPHRTHYATIVYCMEKYHSALCLVRLNARNDGLYHVYP